MDKLIMAPVSLGELYDKISILEIKIEKINDEDKLKNISTELEEFQKIAENHIIDKAFYKKLMEVNKRIWDIEDGIRECERDKHFKERFIDLARAVYLNNDERSQIKKEINLKYDSLLIEEKSYESYK